MAFTVADFDDLYRLLSEHPEWRNRLRPLILGEEFLEVPGRLERIEQLLAQSVERQAAFEERQAAFEVNMAGFAERQAAFEERMDRFDARLEQLVEIARAHERRMNRMDGRMGNIEGLLLEQRYRDYYPDWLADHLHGGTRAFIYQLNRIDAGVKDGTITRDELERVRNLDLIVRGMLPDGSAREALLVAEISYTVNPGDIARVADRADILRRAGYEVIAMAGGYRIEPETATLARETGVIVDLRRAPDAAVA